MHKLSLIKVAIFWMYVCCSCNPPKSGGSPVGKITALPIDELNQDTGMPVARHQDDAHFEASPVLLFQPKEEVHHLVLKGTGTPVDWKNMNYLVFEIFNDTDFSNILHLEFYRKGEEKPQIRARIGLNPQLETQVIFPLSYLDGQEIFMRRFPRQLKGTVLGRRMTSEEIDRIVVRVAPIEPGLFQPSVAFKSAYFAENLPGPLKPVAEPVIDALGQWKKKEWPGKTASEKEMIQRVRQMEATIANASFPQEWSRYGGDKSRKLAGKGFFRVMKEGEKWWFVDPDGYAFLSTGVDVMTPNSHGPVEGMEDLFAWLPKEGSEFSAAISTSRDMKQVSFLTTNLIRVFGDSWREKWETMSANLMRTWRFNTIANWSDSAFIAHQRLPYVLPLKNFPQTPVNVYRDFPDVFSPAYREAAAAFARQLEPYKNDTLLIGYFLRNEPHWGFGSHNLAFEMLSDSRKTETKTRGLAWLAQKYRDDISVLNTAWGTSFASFREMGDRAIDQFQLTPQADQDLWEFSGLMVDEYVKVVSEEVKKVDPNHLNLGMRFASISTDLFYRTGAFVDVFSLNQYSSPDPPATAEIYRRTGKPVLIGEFHHGATDQGLPANGIQAARNQEQRGVALRHYLEQGFARPEVIGMHYFQWNDQPWAGRYDGENYQIGVMDVTLRPYKEWTDAATKTNERLYKVASGKISPFHQIIQKTPYIYY
jgi:hypothetical protein